MIGSGTFIEEIDNKKVGFEFCVLASIYTEEISNQSIYEVFKEIEKMRVTAIAHYFYGGLRAYNFFNGIDKAVTLGDTAWIMQKLGTERCYKIYSESIKTPIEKNGQAPKEVGQSLEV